MSNETTMRIYSSYEERNEPDWKKRWTEKEWVAEDYPNREFNFIKKHTKRIASKKLTKEVSIHLDWYGWANEEYYPYEAHIKNLDPKRRFKIYVCNDSGSKLPDLENLGFVVDRRGTCDDYYEKVNLSEKEAYELYDKVLKIYKPSSIDFIKSKK